MSFCPFMSKPDGINSNMDKMYPCISSCELYTGKQCSLKLLAKSQFDISKYLTDRNNKN